MMSGNCTSKKELLQFIDQVSFAIDDLLLFLDTHPKEKSRFHGNRKEGADKVCGIMKKDSSIL